MSRDSVTLPFRVTRSDQTSGRDDSNQVAMPMDDLHDNDAFESVTGNTYYESSQYMQPHPTAYEQHFTSYSTSTYASPTLPPSVQAAWDAQRATYGTTSMLPANDHEVSTQQTQDSGRGEDTQQYEESLHAPDERSYGASDHHTTQYTNQDQDFYHTSTALSSDAWYYLDSQPYALRDSDESTFWQTSYYHELSSASTGGSRNGPSEFGNESSGAVESNTSSMNCNVPLNITDITNPPGDISCHLCGRVLRGEYARGNLVRHKRTCHSENVFLCEVEGCSRQYRRSDARTHHYRISHPELNIPSNRNSM